MRVETIAFREGGEGFDAVVAFPKAEAPRPAVLVCHAWGGRDEFAEGRARALAELGYVGAAIDLYGVGKRGSDKRSSEALMRPLIDDPMLLRRRLSAAFSCIRGLDGVQSSSMGAIGYCFGGLCAILLARMGLPIRSVVSFHGLLNVGEPSETDTEAQAKILVLHGQDDPMVPPADVGRFAEQMKRLNIEWSLHAYPGVMHAFTNPTANDPAFGTVYDRAADEHSWSAMTAFLAETLTAP